MPSYASQNIIRRIVAIKTPPTNTNKVAPVPINLVSQKPAVTNPAPKPNPAPNPAPAPISNPAPNPAPVSNPNATGLVRFLTVGINYVGTQYQLAGCINDTNNMISLLNQFFPTCKSYRQLTDNTAMKPNKANIMAALDWLVSGLQPGQNILFHYSGHGGLITDKNGNRQSGMDNCIYPCNNGAIEILDEDELYDALVVRIPKGCKCFVILDTCNSGTAIEMTYIWSSPTANTITCTVDKTCPVVAGNVLFLAACQDNQKGADTVDTMGRPSGALTMSLTHAWRTYGPALQLKRLLWDVTSFLSAKGYAQVPQLISSQMINVNGVWDIGSGL